MLQTWWTWAGTRRVRVCGRAETRAPAECPFACVVPLHAVCVFLTHLSAFLTCTIEWELSLSYTYTVMSLDGSTCLGCVYVMPPEKAGFDAQVIYWARSGQPAPAGAASLTAHLGEALEAWLASDAWPFKRVAWPGRKIPWAEWAALPAPGGA